MKPILFVLRMPFEEGRGKFWFCTHCALIEGALISNPHWCEHVEVKRIEHPRPRQEVVELLGEESQSLPVLVLGKDHTITDPIEITQHLFDLYGGAAPHP